MKRLLTIAALLSVAILPSPALAQPFSESSSIRVTHADLDLRTAAGQSRLQARIYAAARRLCASQSAGGIDDNLERRHCLRETIAVARDQANVVIARANQGRTFDVAFALR